MIADAVLGIPLGLPVKAPAKVPFLVKCPASAPR
jgi:hypothetical protein